MRVTFDSNAWEKIFSLVDGDYASVRAAIADRKIDGFICEACFRIESIMKEDRAEYFAEPHLGVRFEGTVMHDGEPYIKMSIGPEDHLHPGLPLVQESKFRDALSGGIQLMRGQSWMSLPGAEATRDPAFFVQETSEERHDRERRQLEVAALIDARGVGYATFEAAGGWNGSAGDPAKDKKLAKACAEWADSELVAAHIAYQNDIICTNDRARSAGVSIFDAVNRVWLAENFGVRLMTLEELAAKVSGG